MPYKKENRDTGHAPPLRVLFAEDDHTIALLMKYALQETGHFVECAEDGQTALERVTEDVEFFDLVVTDHNMPRCSGLRFVENLRRISFPGKIIVHSSGLHPQVAEAYRALSVDYIFAKPLETQELLRVIRDVELEFSNRGRKDAPTRNRRNAQ